MACVESCSTKVSCTALRMGVISHSTCSGRMRPAAILDRLDEPGAPAPVQLAGTSAEFDDFPAGGLVLQAAVRDLPRTDEVPQGDHRWNLDYVWIRPDETRTLAPERLAVGEHRTVPWPLMRRLTRFHLRDYVRGEPFNWQEDAIAQAELSSEIVEVTGAPGASRLRVLRRWSSCSRLSATRR